MCCRALANPPPETGRSILERYAEGGELIYELKPTYLLGDRSVGRCRPNLLLPRKEVIQPHLQVRLPCYDFTPVADPTFADRLP